MSISDITDIADSILNRISYYLEIKKPTPELERHVKDRLKICLDCEHLSEKSFLNKSVHFCDKCKCVFPALIFAYKKKCPDDRWDAIPDDVT